jgi:hypothetical protein
VRLVSGSAIIEPLNCHEDSILKFGFADLLFYKRNMSRQLPTVVPALFPCVLLLSFGVAPSAHGDAEDVAIGESFLTEVRPFLQKNCLGCHGKTKQEAKLDLSGYTTIRSVTSDVPHWEIVLKRLTDQEMPPADAKVQPSTKSRQAIIDWITRMRRHEAERNAGDPGPVLARRLNNA